MMLSDSFTSAGTTKTSPPWGFFSGFEVYSHHDKSHQKPYCLPRYSPHSVCVACFGDQDEFLLYFLVV